MKTKNTIIQALAIAASMTLTASVAMAHSAHDHSTVPYKWELSKNIKSKIDRNFISDNPSPLIGLSHFEQKKLDHYDIRVGNKFQTSYNGLNFKVERTSSGIKIVDANRIGKVSYSDLVPIKDVNSVKRASMNHQAHIGHDHKRLPYEWTFGLETQEKIVRGMFNGEGHVYVGLNTFEQSLLKEYDIKPGNTFQTTIEDNQFLIEKTSAGIKVISPMESHDVVMAPQRNSKM